MFSTSSSSRSGRDLPACRRRRANRCRRTALRPHHDRETVAGRLRRRAVRARRATPPRASSTGLARRPPYVATASMAPSAWAAPMRRHASAPTSGWSAKPTTTPSTARDSSERRAACNDDEMPSAQRSLRTTSTLSGATAATASASCPTTSTTGPSPDPTAASSAWATSGRPRKESNGLAGLASSPRREPRPAASTAAATLMFTPARRRR